MCPLRVILIFLSAAVAGFLVLRSFKDAEFEDEFTEDSATKEKQQLSLLSKIYSAISSGFWTCVDMASGRYLWRIILDPATATAEKIKKKS